MEDGKPDETDTGGKEPNIELSTSEKIDAEYEKTKASNDKLAAELQRGEDLKAKATLGGKSDAGQEAVKPKEETDHDYRVRIQKEMAEGKTDFKDGN